jgi:hypothetical protein
MSARSSGTEVAAKASRHAKSRAFQALRSVSEAAQVEAGLPTVEVFDRLQLACRDGLQLGGRLLFQEDEIPLLSKQGVPPRLLGQLVPEQGLRARFGASFPILGSPCNAAGMERVVACIAAFNGDEDLLGVALASQPDVFDAFGAHHVGIGDEALLAVEVDTRSQLQLAAGPHASRPRRTRAVQRISAISEELVGGHRRVEPHQMVAHGYVEVGGPSAELATFRRQEGRERVQQLLDDGPVEILARRGQRPAEHFIAQLCEPRRLVAAAGGIATHRAAPPLRVLQRRPCCSPETWCVK